MQVIAICVFYSILILAIISLPSQEKELIEKLKEAKSIIESIINTKNKNLEQIAIETNIGMTSLKGILNYQNELKNGINRFSSETIEIAIKRLRKI